MSTKTARPSVHHPLTKSYAIDQIEDVEHLRAVAHRMWEAFQAAHQQATHAVGMFMGYEECATCTAYMGGEGECGCEKWQQWQRKVTDGFGSV